MFLTWILSSFTLCNVLKSAVLLVHLTFWAVTSVVSTSDCEYWKFVTPQKSDLRPHIPYFLYHCVGFLFCHFFITSLLRTIVYKPSLSQPPVSVNLKVSFKLNIAGDCDNENKRGLTCQHAKQLRTITQSVFEIQHTTASVHAWIAYTEYHLNEDIFLFYD